MEKDIKKLKELFNEYHQRSVMYFEKFREEFREEYGESCPESSVDKFCLFESLEYMCECIEKLENKKCSFCNHNELMTIPANEPWSPEHYQCDKCDSTYGIDQP